MESKRNVKKYKQIQNQSERYIAITVAETGREI